MTLERVLLAAASAIASALATLSFLKWRKSRKVLAYICMLWFAQLSQVTDESQGACMYLHAVSSTHITRTPTYRCISYCQLFGHPPQVAEKQQGALFVNDT